MIYIRGGNGNTEEYSEEAERIIEMFEKIKAEEEDQSNETI